MPLRAIVVVKETGEVLIPTQDKWHYGRNVGNITAEIITFCAGAVNGALKRVMNTKE